LKLKHCGRILITLLKCASHIFSLEDVDGESEVFPRLTATDMVRNSRLPDGCPVDEKFRRLSWLLLVPGQVVLLVVAQ
jgi:hypothetical protein